MKAESELPQNLDAGFAGRGKWQQLALAAGRTGTWELRLDEEHPLVLSNEFTQILGIGANRFDGTIESFLERVHSSDRWKVIRNTRRAMARAEDLEFEFRFVVAESEPGWLLCRGRVE